MTYPDGQLDPQTWNDAPQFGWQVTPLFDEQLSPPHMNVSHHRAAMW